MDDQKKLYILILVWDMERLGQGKYKNRYNWTIDTKNIKSEFPMFPKIGIVKENLSTFINYTFMDDKYFFLVDTELDKSQKIACINKMGIEGYWGRPTDKGKSTKVVISLKLWELTKAYQWFI